MIGLPEEPGASGPVRLPLAVRLTLGLVVLGGAATAAFLFVAEYCADSSPDVQVLVFGALLFSEVLAAMSVMAEARRPEGGGERPSC
ncbi:hypothetical protein [Kitasatospora griseola]|uniref:hypothetical protein n=1 Tax=Kitasatospora griseola TaxID=2064 RepID=UPI003662BD99